MKFPDRQINELSDLIKYLKTDAAGIPSEMWFRGHANIEYELIPLIYRYKKTVSEIAIIEKFKQNAALIYSNPYIKQLEWLFVMQHNGAPTRLLDWTENPLAALYFACAGSESKNACLYTLLPVELNQKAGYKKNYIFSITDAQVVTNYAPEAMLEDTGDVSPVAIIGPRSTARIQAQMGVFTIFHRSKTPIDKLYDQSHIWRYMIPSSRKKGILKELSILGVDEFRLFPELPSLGNIIKSKL